MTTYSIGFNGTNVTMNGSSNNKNIPLTDLLMNDGKSPNATNVAEFTRDQSIVNYFDSIKDGTGKETLIELNIYPGASDRSGNYPQYNGDRGIHAIEYDILKARIYNLKRTGWLKLKKGHQLDPPKEYDEVMWESGLGQEVFITTPVVVRKTFGSFIDPLSKTAGLVWPPPENTLDIQPSFMNFIGFGPSSIVAKAKSIMSDPKIDDYSYTMTIKCGDACETKSCVLNDTSNRVDLYTRGNNIKNNIVNKSGNSDEKVKYVVVKEWGDKVQVIIYIIYYFLYAVPKELSVAMLTCDMVVFITCLTFQALCIYTGVLSHERLDLLTQDLSSDQKDALNEQKEQKHYSIVEYLPKNKFEQAIININMKIRKIIEENGFFIRSIETLIHHSKTEIQVGSQKYIFREEFYELCLHDINTIQGNANTNGNTLLETWKTTFSSEVNKTDENLDRLYIDLKKFESQHLLVPFIKIKKGTKNGLTLLSTKSYTAQLPCVNQKPSFANSTESFQVLAAKNYRDTTTASAGGMRGGSRLTEHDINFKTFVEDDDARYPYTFDSSNDPDYNPIKDSYSIDLLEILNHHFNNTLKLIPNKEYIEDGIYTLFVYNSYLNGAGIIDFNEKTLNILLHFYDLTTEGTIIAQLTQLAVAKGSESPRGPSSNDGYFALSPYRDPEENYPIIRTSSSEKRGRDYEPEEGISKWFKFGGSKRKNRTIKKEKKTNKKTRNNKKNIHNKTIKKHRKNKRKSIKKLKIKN